jgi:hypothetical protein
MPFNPSRLIKGVPASMSYQPHVIIEGDLQVTSLVVEYRIGHLSFSLNDGAEQAAEIRWHEEDDLFRRIGGDVADRLQCAQV